MGFPFWVKIGVRPSFLPFFFAPFIMPFWGCRGQHNLRKFLEKVIGTLGMFVKWQGK
jgi:hypothetical protein